MKFISIFYRLLTSTTKLTLTLLLYEGAKGVGFEFDPDILTGFLVFSELENHSAATVNAMEIERGRCFIGFILY